MAIDSVNNNQGNYALTGTIAGAATGALAGGLYGYNSKPWLKDGNLTDEFVISAENKVLQKYKAVVSEAANDMKKLQETGDFSSLSDSTKIYLQEEGYEIKNYEKASKDSLKAFAQDVLDGYSAKNWDEFSQTMQKNLEELSYKGIKAQAEKFNSINVKKDMPLEDLKKIIAENDEFFGVFKEKLNMPELNEANKNDYIELIEKMKKIAVEAPESDIKVTRKLFEEYFEADKKSLKSVSENLSDNINYTSLKETLKNAKNSAALKWAGIGAAVVGAVGLAAGLMTKKSVPAEETQHVDTQA